MDQNVKGKFHSVRQIELNGAAALEPTTILYNEVRSSRYTWLSLFPKGLYEQFQRTSNIWFLVVSVFQLMPFNLNPTDSWSTVLPLVILISFSMVIDGINDYHRREEDKKFNNFDYLRWDRHRFVPVKSKEVAVGDLLMLKEGQIVPADVLFLGILSEETCCYLDVGSIEGYTNLKVVKPVAEVQRSLRLAENSEAFLKRLVATVLVPEPSSDFSVFYGKLDIPGRPRAIELTENEALYRGSIMKGAGDILVGVLYTGVETKTIQNIHQMQRKVSRIEEDVNLWVLFILGVLFAMVLFSILASHFLSGNAFKELSVIEGFVLFTLLYNNIIPISLFVALDLVRVLQIFFIHRASHQKISFKTGNVNEDLGQIEYVLTDKTGTLTESKLSIGGLIVDKALYLNESIEPGDSYNSQDNEERGFVPMGSEEDATTLCAAFPFELLRDRLDGSEDALHHHFARCSALCHDLSLQPKEDTERTYSERLLGTSLDEVALVRAAAELNVKLVDKSGGAALLETARGTEEYTIVHSSPFHTALRRSRVIVSCGNTGEVTLYVKGACDTMQGLMGFPASSSAQEDSDQLCRRGMRTIVLSYRTLALPELDSFTLGLDRANFSMINKTEKIETLFEQLEKGLEYLGTVGIEDEVLEATRDTAQALRDAGIKIWVVSGDTKNSVISATRKAGLLQYDTAMFFLENMTTNISCHRTLHCGIMKHIYRECSETHPRVSVVGRREGMLLSNKQLGVDDSAIIPRRGQRQMTVLATNRAEALRANHPMFKQVATFELKELNFDQKSFNPVEVNFWLSLDRSAFRTALKDSSCKQMLVCVLLAANGVCCHGFLPQDKAQLVRLLKNNFACRPLVLAIGNGNNDISMIQNAHVGVGVNSKESNQAKFFSEIVVSHFSDLKMLVLVHGHWNYSRLARTVLLFFYKNFILTVVFFVYLFMSDYSASSVFDAGLLVGYNIFFTTLPVLVLGVFDEDVPCQMIFRTPQLYSEGIRNMQFSLKNLLMYSLLSVAHGLILSIVIILSMGEHIVSSDGRTEGFHFIGVILFSAVVVTVLLQITIDTYSYSVTYLASIALSVIFFVLFLMLQNYVGVPSEDLKGVGEQLSHSLLAGLLILMCPVICFIISYAAKSYSALVSPGVLESMWLQVPGFVAQAYLRVAEYSANLLRAYKDTGLGADVGHESFELNKYTLHFKSRHIEIMYREQYIEEHIKYYRFVLSFFWVLVFLWTLIEIFTFDAETLFTLSRSFISVVFAVIVFLLFTEVYKQNYMAYNYFIILTGIVVKFAMEITFDRIGTLSSACVPAITYILFNADFSKITAANVLNLLLTLVELIIHVLKEDFSAGEGTVFVLSFMVFLVAITVTSGYVGYMMEKSTRTEFTLIIQQNKNLEDTQRILGFLLPKFVRDRVQEGSRYIAEDQGTVSVIFCDICDFDGIFKDYPPEELTAFLDELFQAFDELCEIVGVTKIETVGKTYMACAGLKHFEDELDRELRNPDHARRAIEFAIRVLHKAEEFSLVSGEKLQFKIGVNSGPVTAGVVGHHKPQFSLVGDTVNTASRMCSTLQFYNAIHISSDTQRAMTNTNGLQFTSQQVQAKGKGLLDTFIVTEDEGGITGAFSGSVVYEESPLLAEGPEKKVIRKGKSMQNMFSSIFDVKDTRVWGFHIRESESARKYRIEKMGFFFQMIELSFITSIVTFGIILVFSVFEFYALELFSSELILVARCSCVLILVLCRFIFRDAYKSRMYPYIMILFLNLCLYTALLYLIIDTGRFNDLIAIEVMYIILLLNFATGAPLPLQTLICLIVAVPWLILAFTVGSDSSRIHAANTIFILGVAVLNISAVYWQEKMLIKSKSSRDTVNKIFVRNKELLTNMMPPHVFESLLEGRETTDKLDNATLLYADIVGFTEWSSGKSPEDVVKMLSNLFTRFDHECVKNNLYKVHTIGDCYVVMGYNLAEDSDYEQHCLNVLEMAKSMITIIKEVNEQNSSKLNMRIGIHTGQVIAGITGTNLVRYDIYGPDVLLANKMESEGASGRINVSEETKAIIERKSVVKYTFEPNRIIQVKSIGKDCQSYFVETNQETNLDTNQDTNILS